MLRDKLPVLFCRALGLSNIFSLTWFVCHGFQNLKKVDTAADIATSFRLQQGVSLQVYTGSKGLGFGTLSNSEQISHTDATDLIFCHIESPYNSRSCVKNPDIELISQGLF